MTEYFRLSTGNICDLSEVKGNAFIKHRFYVLYIDVRSFNCWDDIRSDYKMGFWLVSHIFSAKLDASVFAISANYTYTVLLKPSLFNPLLTRFSLTKLFSPVLLTIDYHCRVTKFHLNHHKAHLHLLRPFFWAFN